jgi:hypothetical protein
VRPAERIRSIEKSNNLVGNRTRDLAACSIVPQPTTLPRTPVVVVVVVVVVIYFKIISELVTFDIVLLLRKYGILVSPMPCTSYRVSSAFGRSAQKLLLRGQHTHFALYRLRFAHTSQAFSVAVSACLFTCIDCALHERILKKKNGRICPFNSSCQSKCLNKLEN